jgi:hypothetical protein
VNFAQYKQAVKAATGQLEEEVGAAYRQFQDRIDKATRAFHDDPSELKSTEAVEDYRLERPRRD